MSSRPQSAIARPTEPVLVLKQRSHAHVLYVMRHGYGLQHARIQYYSCRLEVGPLPILAVCYCNPIIAAKPKAYAFRRLVIIQVSRHTRR